MTALWHELRAKHVGGSEVAALFGESSYLTRYALWLYKAGKLDPPDLSNDDRILAGVHMEPGALAWANARWKTFFQPAKIYVKHHAVKGMGCTPDGVDYTHGKPLYAQVKCVDGLEFRNKWMVCPLTRDGITHAPLHIMLQIQHELECTQGDECWLIVVVGGNRLFRMIIKRDPEVGAMLRKAVEDFWLSIANNDLPEPDFVHDADTIKAFRKTLPVIPDNELEGEYPRELISSFLSKRKLMLLSRDDFEAVDAELEHILGNAQITRCGDYIVRRNKVGTLKVEVLTVSF